METNSTGYQGQDLHMLRNNQNFPLHEFFNNSSGNLSYTFRLTGAEVTDTSTAYESINIEVLKTGSTVDAVNIMADIYQVNINNDEKINNFFVTVKDNATAEQIVILIRLHDTLEKVWLSPEIPKFRDGMTLKYGIMAYFNDNIFADFSYYAQIDYKLGTGAANIFELAGSGDRLIRTTAQSSQYPTNPNPPVVVTNAIKIELPPYLTNSGAQVTLDGSVEILDDGILELHSGDNTKINDRTNILFLSDGFDGTDEGSITAFHDFIRDFNTEALQKEAYSPWNSLMENVNLWSYYTEGIDNTASFEGDLVILNNNTVMDLHKFIESFDEIVNQLIARQTTVGRTFNDFVDFYIGQFGSEFVNFIELAGIANATDPVPPPSFFPPLVDENIVNLMDLCSLVGLPSFANDAIAMSSMRN